MAKSKIVRITQIKSGTGYKKKAKATLKAFGLRKMQQTVEQNDLSLIHIRRCLRRG